MSRDIDIRISAATDRGFAIHEGGQLVAALTTRAEVAEWIEDRLASVPGEVEREQQEIEQAQQDFPNVVRARTGPRGFFSRGR